jgi:ferredoxin
MPNHKIVFLPHKTKIAVPDGETIIHAAMEAGVHINASCGGEGVCGKCRVMIEQGTVEGGQRLSIGLPSRCKRRSGGAHSG